MAKFDFNNSRYARMFLSSPENQRMLQTLVDRRDIFFANHTWYKTQGRKAPVPTPTDHAGLATFTVKARKLETAPLMDLRAPLGDSNQMDKKGFEFYTATIPDFIGQGSVETASERDYKSRLFEEFGNDADVIATWIDDVQMKMDSVDSTMNFMTAQLMTKGVIDYTGIGRGIQAPLHKANIPVENFKKCGALAWAAANAKILTYMKLIEEQYREERGGFGGSLVWQMTRKTFYDVFLQNAEVKELVKNFRYLNKLAYTDGMPVTAEEFNQAFVEYQGISPIEIVTERERNKTNATDKFINGWDDKIVVLRPAGDAVEFEHKSILDKRMMEQYGAKSIDAVFATTNDGLGLLANITTDNGRYKEWHTNIMMSACPALVDFPNHVIIDITVPN